MTAVTDQLLFNEQGLIPAIAQDRLTGEVRMMAWMDRAAVEATMLTRRATFFSRSRGRTWVKGEESGNFLEVFEVLADCDGDTLLLLCEPKGPSCHTGRANCFFRPLGTDVRLAEVEHQAAPLLGRLEEVIEVRKHSTSQKSYTKSLFDGGASKIGEKVREEAGEMVEALENETEERVANEAADVLFHLLVGLSFRDVSWRQVLAVLAGRFGLSGHDEKANRR